MSVDEFLEDGLQQALDGSGDEEGDAGDDKGEDDDDEDEDGEGHEDENEDEDEEREEDEKLKPKQVKEHKKVWFSIQGYFQMGISHGSVRFCYCVGFPSLPFLRILETGE